MKFLKKEGFHWRKALFQVPKHETSGFVRFPTKPHTVSQKFRNPRLTSRVYVAFAAWLARFQAGTVIADRTRITASVAPALSTTTKEFS
ncbi:hypothetical protein [Rhodoferax sp.]|uniref:hypothetical protein n=1 Tax=Rhodoferax sp. TaxID=50421 RepID=UPI00271CE1A9|nr:hypothetical protein [Rhodoferax sp.]MDO8319871.1 hypothetical protein [Rhodoferax sp.]